ncbi:unnamed protein product, partial [Rangifer tarandus platyrhynchus]
WAQIAPHVLTCPTKQVSLPMAQLTSKHLGYWELGLPHFAASACLPLTFLISKRREDSRISSIPWKHHLPKLGISGAVY